MQHSKHILGTTLQIGLFPIKCKCLTLVAGSAPLHSSSDPRWMLSGCSCCHGNGIKQSATLDSVGLSVLNKLLKKENNRIIPLFTPIIINVILQVHGEVDHPNLKKINKKYLISLKWKHFMKSHDLTTIKI